MVFCTYLFKMFCDRQWHFARRGPECGLACDRALICVHACQLVNASLCCYCISTMFCANCICVYACIFLKHPILAQATFHLYTMQQMVFCISIVHHFFDFCSVCSLCRDINVHRSALFTKNYYFAPVTCTFGSVQSIPILFNLAGMHTFMYRISKQGQECRPLTVILSSNYQVSIFGYIAAWCAFPPQFTSLSDSYFLPFFPPVVSILILQTVQQGIIKLAFNQNERMIPAHCVKRVPPFCSKVPNYYKLDQMSVLTHKALLIKFKQEKRKFLNTIAHVSVSYSACVQIKLIDLLMSHLIFGKTQFISLQCVLGCKRRIMRKLFSQRQSAQTVCLLLPGRRPNVIQ